jgi:hypothetical protein
MEKSPSNPMSEYEFAELPEENVEEDVLPVSRSYLQYAKSSKFLSISQFTQIE